MDKSLIWRTKAGLSRLTRPRLCPP